MTDDAALEEFYRALREDDPEALYDRAPCGYLSTTPTGLVVKVNETFLAWTGYQREDLVGRRRFTELLTAGGRIYHETHYLPMLLMQGRAHEIALDVVAADGTRLPALVNSILVRDRGGEPVVVRTAVFDASHRRAYERELLHAKQRAEESEAQARVLVRTLQETLIPPSPPPITGLDVAAAFRPAGNGEEIGGDFYDIFEVGRDDWMIALGDVQGKGAPAAVIAALARYTIRAEAVRLHSPAPALQATNEVLLRHETERFCSAVLLRLYRHGASWALTVCSAGHPLPLLRRGAAGSATVGRSDVLLGIFDDVEYRNSDVALEPADVIVVYTDGVTEARRGQEWFGEGRLRAALEHDASSVRDFTEALLADVVEFQSGVPHDDIAIVTVAVTAS